MGEKKKDTKQRRTFFADASEGTEDRLEAVRAICEKVGGCLCQAERAHGQQKRKNGVSNHFENGGSVHKVC